MSDLPTPSGNNPVNTNNPIIQSQSTGGVNKEIGNPPMGGLESASTKELGREADTLPKEVTSAGVTIQPTTIPVPQPLAKMGVAPSGANIPMPTAAVTLPISDDQIAQGLGKSIRESFLWLAQWCLRRLKQVHIGLQSVHGRLTRVTTHA